VVEEAKTRLLSTTDHVSELANSHGFSIRSKFSKRSLIKRKQGYRRLIFEGSTWAIPEAESFR
jgi:hypothetical protein